MNTNIIEQPKEITFQDLKGLISESFKEYSVKGIKFPFQNFNDAVLESKMNEGHTLVALSDNKLVGFINYSILLGNAERYAYIFLIAVHPDFRYKGIASMLVNKLEEDLKASKDEIYYITTNIPEPVESALSFFTKANFRKTSYARRSNEAHRSFSFHKPLSEKSKWNSLSFCKYNLYLTTIQCKMRHEGDGEHSALHNFVSSLKYRAKWMHYIPKQHKTEREVHVKGKATVVFFASCLSMWKYQYLYEEMLRNPKYEPYVVLSPFVNYSVEVQKEDLRKLRAFFDANNVKYIDFNFEGEVFDVRAELNPDIIFYPQPYLKCLSKKHQFKYFLDKLTAYYPYGFFTENAAWAYNNQFLNLAWKLFYATGMQLRDAQTKAANRGRNVEVVGYPGADEFTLSHYKDPWKPVNGKLKRVIWAPHFSINAKLTNQSNFLWMADYMLQLADTYKDRIQFAFKPHPRLKSELYKAEEWGKEKTDLYYSKWETKENCQLETGDFISLFLNSDAMVHDSASFTVDYHYTTKPVMFISKNVEAHKNTLGDFGKKAVDLHYIGTNTDEIQHFIDDTVLGGNDPMKEERMEFYNNYLLPPNGKTAAQNTVDKISEILFD